jgi:hypothetical protein
MSAQAIASPIARVAVVDDVGARFRGQASLLTATLRWQVEYFASSDAGLPDIDIIGILRSVSRGMKRNSSSVCPEFEIANTTSPAVNIPKSPWKASRGFTKNEGVPVLASVEAI